MPSARALSQVEVEPSGWDTDEVDSDDVKVVYSKKAPDIAMIEALEAESDTGSYPREGMLLKKFEVECEDWGYQIMEVSIWNTSKCGNQGANCPWVSRLGRAQLGGHIQTDAQGWDEIPNIETDQGRVWSLWNHTKSAHAECVEGADVPGKLECWTLGRLRARSSVVLLLPEGAWQGQRQVQADCLCRPCPYCHMLADKRSCLER